MMRTVTALALILVASCNNPQPTHQSAPADDQHYTNAHEVLRTHCSGCHLGSTSSSPRALAVFDLEQKRWWTTITDEQLDKLDYFLAGKPPDGDEAAPMQDRNLVKTFVEREQKLRAPSM